VLHSFACPDIGHSIAHHFGEGAAVWGQTLTPSIAHLLQAHNELTIDYARVGPGIVFSADKGSVMLPYVLDTASFRLHAETSAFRHAAGHPSATVEAAIAFDVGAGCTLKIWGRVAMEASARDWKPASMTNESTHTVPVIFALAFWEISKGADARMAQIIRESAEKDRKIRELESRVALAMCSQ
jgi:hypothetical protein